MSRMFNFKKKKKESETNYMKLSKSKLRKLIREEVRRSLLKEEEMSLGMLTGSREFQTPLVGKTIDWVDLEAGLLTLRFTDGSKITVSVSDRTISTKGL